MVDFYMIMGMDLFYPFSESIDVDMEQLGSLFKSTNLRIER